MRCGSLAGFAVCLCLLAGSPLSAAKAPDGWTMVSPRDEIRPEFEFRPSAEPNKSGVFVIRADGREGPRDEPWRPRDGS